MTEVTFYEPEEIADSLLKFAVIAARFENRWIFCRHKKRTTWEIPGGHREPGEAIDDAARRELWEETGAKMADIRRVCVYGVVKDGVASYGMLYYADVMEMETLPPELEIGEIQFADTLPAALTYPEIQPYLYEKVQGWRSLQNSAEELWDVYDENRNLTERFHRRGDPMEKGDYHLVVYIWLQNSDGEYLITKRSPNKGFPNLWETTGGSALAGETSLAAALREVREETGLILSPEKGQLIASSREGDYFQDIWLFRQDFDLKDVILQPGETADSMYANRETILQMQQTGKFIPNVGLRVLFDRADLNY